LRDNHISSEWYIELFLIYNKYRYLNFGYTYLGYNLKRPLFQDKRVRQALSYAINKQELIDGVLLGYGKVATGPYKPDTWVYNGNVPKYSYDPDKARQLLAEAGWQDTDDNGILDKDGKELAFTIVTNQGNDLRSKTGEIIQRRFKEIGVAVNLRIIEWATFLKEFINPGNFDATILGWTGGPEPLSIRAILMRRFSVGLVDQSRISIISGIRVRPARVN